MSKHGRDIRDALTANSVKDIANHVDLQLVEILSEWDMPPCPVCSRVWWAACEHQIVTLTGPMYMER